LISTPFSAWTLRIENMRSCLRNVDAPSTPISSAIATRSAGVFFLSSFKCILDDLFLGRWCWLRETRAHSRQDAAHREKESAGKGVTDRRARRDSRYVRSAVLSISAKQP